MNKTTFVFIGGSLFGIISAFAIIKSTSVSELTENSVDAQNQVTEFQPKKIQTSQHTMESMSDMDRLDSKLPVNTDTSSISTMHQPAPSNPVSDNNPANSNATVQNTVTTIPADAIPVIQPTTEQVQHYDDIDKLISSAVNNPTIKLHYLIKKADSLTIEQRKVLTQRAIAMLESGELDINQFASK